MDEAQANEQPAESDKEFVTSDGDASGDGESEYEPSSSDMGEDEDDMEVVQKGQQNILHEKRRRSR